MYRERGTAAVADSHEAGVFGRFVRPYNSSTLATQVVLLPRVARLQDNVVGFGDNVSPGTGSTVVAPVAPAIP